MPNRVASSPRFTSASRKRTKVVRQIGKTASPPIGMLPLARDLEMSRFALVHPNDRPLSPAARTFADMILAQSG